MTSNTPTKPAPSIPASGLMPPRALMSATVQFFFDFFSVTNKKMRGPLSAARREGVQRALRNCAQVEFRF
jgi:hypothetical protein